MKHRCVVAMSGGIDSSVSAKLLIEAGYEVIGVTFEMFQFDENISYNANVNDAIIVADTLKIKHFVVDIKDDFKQKVVEYFVNSYFEGKTPNPCTLCNRIIKWKHLLDFADNIDAQFVATGHYASIGNYQGNFFISKATDNQKDQSYFLWNLTQNQLSRTIFPLTNLTKTQIKEIAKQSGLDVVVHKSESFDVCFTKGTDYREFLQKYARQRFEKMASGDIVTEDGKVVGKHNGIANYTIGQRKGLGVAMGEPYFVKQIDAKTNKIIITKRENFNTRSLIAEQINLQKFTTIPENHRFLVRIRYRDAGHWATIKQKDDKLHIQFDDDVFGIASGQSAVIYDGDDIVGGGVIS